MALTLNNLDDLNGMNGRIMPEINEISDGGAKAKTGASKLNQEKQVEQRALPDLFNALISSVISYSPEVALPDLSQVLVASGLQLVVQLAL